MSLILKDDEQSTYTAVFTDRKGADAKVDGVPVWSAAPTGILTLTPAADGMTCLVAAAGIGVTTVTCDADADLGPGVTDVVLTDDVTVIAGNAAGGTLTSGTVEPQP